MDWKVIFVCLGTSESVHRLFYYLTFRTTLRGCLINPLAPGKFEWYFKYVIFKQILVIDGWGISCEFALIWMSLDFTDDQSTLVAWRHQAITWANVDPDLCRHMV